MKRFFKINLILLFSILIHSCSNDEIDELKKDIERIESTNTYETVNGDINIWSQQMLDSIGDLGIKNVFGRITITGNSIDDLTPFSELENVNSLVIENTSITSLSALENLKTISGDLTLSTNPLLNDITKLSFLEKISGSLRFDDNSSLTDLTGLQNLKEIGESLSIIEMPIEDLSWFSAIEKLNGLYLAYNDHLKDLSHIENGIPNIKNLSIISCPEIKNLQIFSQIGSDLNQLVIDSNDSLESLTGLENVSVVNLISISGNKILKTLDGLENLKTANEYLLIIKNESLESIEALQNFEYAETIFIFFNYKLSDFCPLKKAIENNNASASIDDNSPDSNRYSLYMCDE